jgi:ryanodine receptor 2
LLKLFKNKDFSQSVILNSTPDLLEKNFLPVSAKISETANVLYARELALKTARYADSTDRESTEGDLQHDYEVLVRNIYAFYPLLIKYVDLHKATWLKHPDESSEKLYFHIAEVFNIWLKSKMFAREEKTFVSSNEIDNMILIMPNKAAGAGINEITTAVVASEPKSNGKKKRGKAGGPSKKFTSLIVAGLKRLIQIGINFFDGKEQEMIQMAKQKFIEIKVGPSEGSSKSKQLAIQKNPVTSNNDDSLELSKEQEDAVLYFIQQYFKSTEASSKEGSTDNYSVNEAIDKDTYQKTQWQRMLYRKISSKRHLILNMQNLDQMAVIERIIDIAKVLYGLHMVDHPQIKSKGTWRKLISGQRKKAVMACFRMAPLYSIPHHRAINLFLKAYKQAWLEVETENDLDISSLIPDLCPKITSSGIENESENQEAPSDESKKDSESSVAVKTEVKKLSVLIDKISLKKISKIQLAFL